MQAIPAIKLRIAENPQLGRHPVVRIAETRRSDAGGAEAGLALGHEPGMKVVVSRHVTRYSERVILSFRHKGLEKLYRDGTKKGVQADHVPKLLRILSALDVAQGPDDLAIPSFRTHRLKGDLAGHYSIWVNGNWRITFRFIESDAELVDYQDYH
jgi:proteic killer suppression protein